MALISAQVLDLGWRFNPAEHRNEHGEWSRLGGEAHDVGGKDYAPADHSRLLAQRGYKDPADHPFFQAHPVSAENVMASYDRAPEAVREQGMRWYADAHVIAKAIAHGDADKGAGVLAAYSPQTAWQVNMMNAARALELGRAIGPGEGMITRDMQAHAQRAIDGKAADEANTASKTRAFARLIRNGGDEPGDEQGQVVIDRHAMSVAAGHRLTRDDVEGKGANRSPIGDDRYYQHVADTYREAARRISERDGVPVAPHQLQAITWLQQQDENDAADTASGGALNKGRATMMKNAWNTWDTYAGAKEIPTYPGTTMLDGSNLLSAQVIELRGWDGWRTEPRDSRGRWTSFPGSGEAAEVMEKNREGFSVSPRTGESPQHGFMVALDGHTHRYPATILDDHYKLQHAIDDLLMQERDAFRGKDMYIGGWVEDGKLWLDPSQNVPDRATAERLGRERDQVGIFDLDTFNTINTGGSGGGRIIDHANPGQGARSHPGGLLGSARRRADGGGRPDRLGYPGGIAAQALDLAGGWKDAWRHEPRGPHGEWIRGEALVTGAAGKLQASKKALAVKRLQEMYSHAYYQNGNALEAKDIAEAIKHVNDGDNGGAAAALARAALDSDDFDAARKYQKMAAEMAPQLYKKADASPEAKAVGELLNKSAAMVPAMYGPGEHLDYDGKPPEIFEDADQPGVLAGIDWDGRVQFQRTVAQHIQAALDHPGQEVKDPGSFVVPLHEETHAVLPDGEDRMHNGDMDAYQNMANADIEEGFTQLGAAQHAGEYFDKLGIGNSPVSSVNQNQLGSDAYMLTLNYSRGAAFGRSLTDASNQIRSGDYAGARRNLQTASSALDSTDPDDKGPALEIKRIDDALAGAQASHKTMRQLADEMSAPEQFRTRQSWGNYRTQVGQAYDWTSAIAQMQTGKGEEDPDTQRALRALSDQVNAVGTAAKPTVMARHVIADMDLPAGQQDAVLAATRQAILDDWDNADTQAETLQKARQSAKQKLQQLQEERAAA